MQSIKPDSSQLERLLISTPKQLISPRPEVVYFSNRAACSCNFRPYHEHAKIKLHLGYLNHSPPHLVVADCNEALRRDPGYVKALNRRANALGALGKFHESLRGRLCATGL